MSEENKTVELKEEELEKVNGGGSGYAENGIHGETYTSVIIGRYYCGKQHPTDGDCVLYVVDTNIGKYCCRAISERLRIDGDNNWHTECRNR